MSNISSLGDLRKKEEVGKSTDKDAKKRNELFIGGLDQRGGGSGLAVLGPPPDRSARLPNAGGPSVFDSIVGKATNATSPHSDDSIPSPAEHAAGSSGHRITLYRNGFTVDNGPLRDVTTPENIEFLSSLDRGDVPRELQQQRKPGENRMTAVDVMLDDRRGEDYVPPPAPAYIAFSGQGAVLRRDASSSSSSSACVFSSELLANVEIPAVDESKPSTTVQVRTSQGKKLRIKLNQEATVFQLAAMVLRETGGEGGAFTLGFGFPPVDVQDGSLSTKDAGLVGASITQKSF